MKNTKHTESIFNKLNSFSDIVQTMVDGVRKEWVKIDMSTYGDFRAKTFLTIPIGTVCYGCAATNTLCELMGESFSPEDIDCITNRQRKVNFGITSLTLGIFESSVDDLRSGEIGSCLTRLKRIEEELGFKIPEFDDISQILCSIDSKGLPCMDKKNKEQLKMYQKFATKLKAAGY